MMAGSRFEKQSQCADVSNVSRHCPQFLISGLKAIPPATN